MNKLIDELESLLKQVNEKTNEIISEAEELKDELDVLQEKYDDLEQDLRENYKLISKYEFYGVSESDFRWLTFIKSKWTN